MKEIALMCIFIAFTSLGSGQISVENSKTDMNPLKAGTTHELNASISNDADIPREISFITKISTGINHSQENSIFDVSGTFDTSDDSTNFECSFSYEDAWVYTCPADKNLRLDGGSDGELDLEIGTPLNMRGGSNILNVNTSVKARIGAVSESEEVTGDEEEVSIGEITVSAEGEDMNGEVASVESFIFEDASSEENLGRFLTDISNHDSVRFSYSYPDSFVRNRDFEFNLYSYSEDGWSEVSTDLNTENNTVTASLSGDSYYSFYVDRRRLTIDELIDRENNITRDVQGSSIDVEATNLGQFENITVPVTGLKPKGGIGFSGFSFMSNVNSTAGFEVEVLENLPAGIQKVPVEGYRPVGYARAEADPEESLDFKSYTFDINSSRFEYQENVDSYRYTNGKWVKMDTNYVSQAVNFTSYRADADGNSVLSFGVQDSSIKISNISHQDKILDNETLVTKVSLKNSLKGLGEKEVKYTIPNESRNIKTVEVPGETTKNIEFSSANIEPGNHTLKVNNRTSKFNVELRPIQFRLVESVPLISSVNTLYFLMTALSSVGIAIISYLLYRSSFNLRFSWRDLLERISIEKPEIPFLTRQDNMVCVGVESSDDQKEEPSQDSEGDFMCSICGEDFDTAAALTLHHKKFHEDSSEDT